MTFATSTRTSRATSAFSFTATLARFADVWHQRRALRRMDDAQLMDLGLTRAEANAEAKRPFWDAPETWRC